MSPSSWRKTLEARRRLSREEQQKNIANFVLFEENSVSPNDRYTYAHQRVQEMATGESAKFLAAFGVSIDGISNIVRINQRKTPKVRLLSFFVLFSLLIECQK